MYDVNLHLSHSETKLFTKVSKVSYTTVHLQLHYYDYHYMITQCTVSYTQCTVSNSCIKHSVTVTESFKLLKFKVLKV